MSRDQIDALRAQFGHAITCATLGMSPDEGVLRNAMLLLDEYQREREECAKIADELARRHSLSWTGATHAAAAETAREIARRIRARGRADEGVGR